MKNHTATARRNSRDSRKAQGPEQEQGSDVTIDSKREQQKTTIETTTKQQQPTLLDYCYNSSYNNHNPEEEHKYNSKRLIKNSRKDGSNKGKDQTVTIHKDIESHLHRTPTWTRVTLLRT